MAKKKVVMRSGFEERIRANLEQRKVKYEYETEKLKYIKSCCPKCKHPIDAGVYTPDFIFRRTAGVHLYVEAKGRFTAPDRKKLVSVMRDNKGINLRILLQEDSRIGKSPNPRRIGKRKKDEPARELKADKRKRLSEWCAANGFIFAIGEVIPEAWL
jgi:hypothetical protein